MNELRTLIGAIIEHTRRDQLRVTDSDAIADAGAELREQSCLEPSFAGAGNRRRFACRPERHICDSHAPAQRIRSGDAADCAQRAVLAFEHDARKCL